MATSKSFLSNSEASMSLMSEGSFEGNPYPCPGSGPGSSRRVRCLSGITTSASADSDSTKKQFGSTLIGSNVSTTTSSKSTFDMKYSRSLNPSNEYRRPVPETLERLKNARSFRKAYVANWIRSMVHHIPVQAETDSNSDDSRPEVPDRSTLDIKPVGSVPVTILPVPADLDYDLTVINDLFQKIETGRARLQLEKKKLLELMQDHEVRVILINNQEPMTPVVSDIDIADFEDAKEYYYELVLEHGKLDVEESKHPSPVAALDPSPTVADLMNNYGFSQEERQDLISKLDDFPTQLECKTGKYFRTEITCQVRPSEVSQSSDADDFIPKFLEALTLAKNAGGEGPTAKKSVTEAFKNFCNKCYEVFNGHNAEIQKESIPVAKVDQRFLNPGKLPKPAKKVPIARVQGQSRATMPAKSSSSSKKSSKVQVEVCKDYKNGCCKAKRDTCKYRHVGKRRF